MKISIFKKTLAVLAGIMILSTIFASVAMAASSSWDYTMYRRACDGAANGEFHTLAQGSAYVSGSHFLQNSPVNQSTTAYYYIRRRTSFLGTYVTLKYTTRTVYNNNQGSSSIYISFTADANSDLYYIRVEKDLDYWNQTGSGTIAN